MKDLFIIVEQYFTKNKIFNLLTQEDLDKLKKDTYILLGTLYREYTERERGFRARGSLWGWLWDYQKEEETSFEKYSVLKLFSYTKEADGTKKILGISF